MVAAGVKDTPPLIRVQVVVAWPEQQWQQSLQVSVGTTLAALLLHPQVQAMQAQVQSAGHHWPSELGVWGRRVTAEQVLQEGDRVEGYRPLQIDPKQIRRLRAERHPVGRRVRTTRRTP